MIPVIRPVFGLPSDLEDYRCGTAADFHGVPVSPFYNGAGLPVPPMGETVAESG